MDVRQCSFGSTLGDIQLEAVWGQRCPGGWSTGGAAAEEDCSPGPQGMPRERGGTGEEEWMSRPEEAKSWEKVEKEQLKGWEESLRAKNEFLG